MKPTPRYPPHQGLSNHLPKPCRDLPKNICFFCFVKFSLTKLFNGSLHRISKHYKTHHLIAHLLPPHQSNAFPTVPRVWWVLPWFGRLGDLIYSTWQNKPPSLINKHIYMHNTFFAFVGWILLTSLYVERVLLLVDS